MVEPIAIGHIHQEFEAQSGFQKISIALVIAAKSDYAMSELLVSSSVAHFVIHSATVCIGNVLFIVRILAFDRIDDRLDNGSYCGSYASSTEDGKRKLRAIF